MPHLQFGEQFLLMHHNKPVTDPRLAWRAQDRLRKQSQSDVLLLSEQTCWGRPKAFMLLTGPHAVLYDPGQHLAGLTQRLTRRQVDHKDAHTYTARKEFILPKDFLARVQALENRFVRKHKEQATPITLTSLDIKA